VGVYKGTLPCANCSGTVSELTLASSNQYQLKETRSGLNETPHETSGTWDILLQDDGKGTMKKIFRLNPDRPDKVRYFRPAGMDLVLLDTNGKEITDTIPHILQLQK
jgi:copper homeostasis protein (lipoprotein)